MRHFCIALALIIASLASVTRVAAQPVNASAERLVERARFTVAVIGTGPDVILIPGLASPRDVWQPTIDQLRDRYRLHIVQIRGFGDAPGVNADGPVLEPFIADLAAYITDADLERPAVIGHSMGGLSAAMIAARHPDLVGRVLIEDSLPFAGLIFAPGATVDTIRPQAEALLPMMLAMGQRPADRLTLQRMSATEAGQAQVAAWGAASDHRVTARLFYDVLLTDIRPELPRITVPVTVLYPAYDSRVVADAVVDSLYINAYAGLATVNFVKIGDSRHFIALDQPVRFAAEVEAFLVRHGR